MFFISSWEVYAGSHDLSLGSEDHRIVVKTTESIVHPDWNPSTLANDIALIKLPERIEFSDGNWNDDVTVRQMTPTQMTICLKGKGGTREH